MPERIEAELATADQAEKWRHRQLAELVRALLTGAYCLSRDLERASRSGRAPPGDQPAIDLLELA
jgi:hypothetical protein